LGILTGQIFMPKLPNLRGSERNNFLERTVEPLNFIASPNPVNDILKITFLEQINKGEIGFIELKNITGHTIKRILLKEENEVIIPVEKFPSGIYVIVMKVNETVISHQKIVIQH
jgi:Secretion system C-terminal sorting domain